LRVDGKIILKCIFESKVNVKCTLVQALRLCTGRMVKCTVVQALRLCTGRMVKCIVIQALRICTGRTAHRGNRGIALPFS
jgi:hypothetical protein